MSFPIWRQHQKYQLLQSISHVLTEEVHRQDRDHKNQS